MQVAALSTATFGTRDAGERPTGPVHGGNWDAGGRHAPPD